MGIELTTIKDFSIVAAGLIGLVTFVTGALEYSRRGRHDRANTFIEMRRRFQESPVFRRILDLLSVDSPDLVGVSVQDRRNLVGFLEEVGLMVNSRLVRVEVARLMFGVYIDLVDRSENFWSGLDRDSSDWTMFHRLRDRVNSLEAMHLDRDSRLRF